MRLKGKTRVRFGRPLRQYWMWNAIFAIIMIIPDVYLLIHERRSGLIATAFTAAYFLALIGVYLYFRPRILQELINFATSYGQVQKEILYQMELPAMLLEPDGKVLWHNQAMGVLAGMETRYRKSITAIFPEINRGSLASSVDNHDVNTSYNGRDFRAHVQRILVEELVGASDLIKEGAEGNYLYMVYMFDETVLHQLQKDNYEQKCSVGLIYIDNYEEVMERTDEVHQSLLNVLVERKISKYFSSMDALVKKLEKDKYLLIMTRKTLDSLKEERFSILEGVKTINIGNDINLTVSGGIGEDGGSYMANYDMARAAIEMALGRGGDQVVVRSTDEISFFGGKTQRSEKTTRVKARVKAQALRELMLAQDRIVIMGHSLTDMDSFGATIGVFRAAAAAGKKSHIVLGELNTNIREWVTLFRESKDHPDDMFITHEQAIDMTDESTAVIVVDTNRENMVECREILPQAGAIVVLDHHRQTQDSISNASLLYIEPAASSACEMIAEILQYFEEEVPLKNLEADCIYAGIVIDTQSFVVKTGVRTFEAAAYLRRSGADTTRVRKILRDSAASYMAKAEAVGSAQTFMDYYAISTCNAEGLEDPNVTGAQAANDLLNIAGVKASFVLTPVKGRIFISARSIDELNVQLVMERLGGGGHMNIAGAQLADVTVEEAEQKLKDVLKQMTEEGAI